MVVFQGPLKIQPGSHRILELGLLDLDRPIGVRQLGLQFPVASHDLDAVRVKIAKAVEGDWLVEIGLGRDSHPDALGSRYLDEVETTRLLLGIFFRRSHVDAPEAYLVVDFIPLFDRRNGHRHHPRERRGEEVAAEPIEHRIDRIRHRSGELRIMTHHVQRARHLLHPLDIPGVETWIPMLEGMQLEKCVEPLQNTIQPRRATPDGP